MHKDGRMGRIVVTEFISIDGVVEAPGGEPGYQHSGWVGLVPFTDDFGAYKFSEVMDADAHLLGGVTYDSFAGAWPERTDEAGFADRINSMPKYVVTARDALDWQNSHVVHGDLVEQLTTLKDEVGTLLVAGSITLVQSLVRADLVDEYRLTVFPVVLGSGRRLFPDDAPDKSVVALQDTKLFDNGVVLHTYVRER